MLEIALRLAPPQHRARRAAEALRRELAAHEGLRLVSIDHDAGRTVLVVAVAIGEPAAVRAGTGQARQGLQELHRLVDDFHDCDPALVPLPGAA